MIIILGKIPKETKKSDIVQFFSPALKMGLFKKPGEIKQIKMPILKDERTNLFSYYSLVFIEPNEIAIKAIKKLNRKFFNGNYITVREFHHRSALNERRVDVKEWSNPKITARVADRRQASLKVRSSSLVSFSN
jgi:RNA recognition motif-containing protein